MQRSTQTYPLSTPTQDSVEGVIGGSIFALRERECELFAEDSQSPVALRLALLRGELLRLLSGLPVRIDSLIRAIGPDDREGASRGEVRL